MSCIFSVITPFTQHILPYPMWFPFDYEKNEPLFWLSVLYESITVFPNCCIAIAIDLIPIMFMTYILAMMEQLCDRLEGLKRGSSDELIRCVNTHLKILELKNKVEKIFSAILFLQCLLSCFILCTVSFALTNVSQNKSISMKPIFFYSNF